MWRCGDVEGRDVLGRELRVWAKFSSWGRLETNVESCCTAILESCCTAILESAGILQKGQISGRQGRLLVTAARELECLLRPQIRTPSRGRQSGRRLVGGGREESFPKPGVDYVRNNVFVSQGQLRRAIELGG